MSIKTNAKSTWGVRASEGASAAVVDPHKRLATGILLQATKDALSGDLGAVLWLGSYDAELYCDVLEFHHDKGLELMTTILADDNLMLSCDTGYLENINQVGAWG